MYEVTIRGTSPFSWTKLNAYGCCKSSQEPQLRCLPSDYCYFEDTIVFECKFLSAATLAVASLLLVPSIVVHDLGDALPWGLVLRYLPDWIHLASSCYDNLYKIIWLKSFMWIHDMSYTQVNTTAQEEENS
ncbi:Pyridoxine/pyridoxamine 5'-phosphate oxidase [Gossypium australe]|uniref:Pyridoxine/pyridoxamine 5'-phosphate oxidase n=1 Tax=Gossypium australe TaxID=47621 RepID=A0A5B6WYV4_9ROSI|nr:Pyridoxine/pyridoxamine 5'-phosphate oxidase [Gossypium australe]